MAERAYQLPEEHGLPYRLGRAVDHDERSKRFVAPRATTLRSVKHRYWLSRPLDQNGIGACTGFAGTAMLAHVPLYKTGTLSTLTNDLGFGLYSRATEIDPFTGTWRPDDTGSSGLAVCKALRERGLIVGYDWAFGLDQALGALSLVPLMVGTYWSESMFWVDAHGLMRVSGAVVGGHEWVVDGLDLSTKRVRGLCCWGRWGYDGLGHFWLSIDDFAHLLAQQGDAAVLRR